MRLLPVLLLALILWTAHPVRAQFTVLQDPDVWHLLSQAPQDPAERLALADRALSRLDPEAPGNTHIRMDLLEARAEALEALGRTAEAAAVYEEKATLAEAQGLSLNHDPVDLMARSQDLHAKSGDIDSAVRAFLAGERLLSGDDPADSRRHIVELLFATDRARSGAAGPRNVYGHARGPLEQGIARVSIPPTHRRGRLEHPSLWRMEFHREPGRHVVLEDVSPLPSPDFFDMLADRLSNAPQDEVLVLIHGFNVDFDSAMRRSAQITHDLRYEGVPIVYSWPSRGSTLGYVADTAAVRHSGRNLSRFLDALVDQAGATSIHLVAHSMGNRALTDALELMALRRDADAEQDPVFEEVLFAAPDVDAGLFGAMAETFRPLARRMTLYGSSEDLALDVSRRIHGDAPRAGEGGPLMTPFQGIDSIDMSAAGRDMLAHQYYAEDSAARLDMLMLIWRNTSPERRCGLSPEPREGGTVWRLSSGPCSDRTLFDIIASLRRAGIERRKDAETYLDSLATELDLSREIRDIVSTLLTDSES
ncbi:alpha/beta hydrolase [Lutimaribacter marinistellae]|uniref:Alpha/beta hydrolase n=1 Tax=Lutimaribacter marinistellae TaxID=1820329 RepID=A0ABV7TMX2_9RHOB